MVREAIEDSLAATWRVADYDSRFINVVNAAIENGSEEGISFYFLREPSYSRAWTRHSGIDKNSVVTREGKIPMKVCHRSKATNQTICRWLREPRHGWILHRIILQSTCPVG